MTTLTTSTTSTGGISIAYDYSPYLERIASALERISTSLTTATTLAQTTGIRVSAPYDYSNSIDLYNWYITQNHPLTTSSYTSTIFTSLTESIDSIVSNFPKFK